MEKSKYGERWHWDEAELDIGGWAATLPALSAGPSQSS